MKQLLILFLIASALGCSGGSGNLSADERKEAENAIKNGLPPGPAQPVGTNTNSTPPTAVD